NVVFNNTLSNARLRYEHFRPELGQVQKVFAAWSSPRSWQVDAASKDGSTVYRSFSGSGTRVDIDWDGTDAGGIRPNAQLIGYFFYDLGPAGPATPSGGSGDPPAPATEMSTGGSATEGQAAPYPSSAE